MAKLTDEEMVKIIQLIQDDLIKATLDQKVLKTTYLYTTKHEKGFHLFASYCYHTTLNQFGVVFSRVKKLDITSHASFGINETAVNDIAKYMNELSKETVTILYGTKDACDERPQSQTR